VKRVYVSIGSNVNREANVRAAVRNLGDLYGRLIVSTVYANRAVGFAGDDFFNLVVGFETDRPLEAVVDDLRRIELDHGRERHGPKFAPRTLDLDLLLYGNLVVDNGAIRVPRNEITRYAFVLGPLAEIAGEERHPETGLRFKDLWSAFDSGDQSLIPVSFTWDGETVSV